MNCAIKLITFVLFAGLLAAQPHPAGLFDAATSVFTLGQASGPIEEQPSDTELLDVLHLMGVYLYHQADARSAEAAYELGANTKEAKAAIKERYAKSRKLADDALAKVNERVAVACKEHKFKSCAMSLPFLTPKSAKLRGTK